MLQVVCFLQVCATKTLYAFVLLSLCAYIPCLSRSSWRDNSSNVCGGMQIMKLHIMQCCSPSSSFFSHLRPKDSPRHLLGSYSDFMFHFCRDVQFLLKFSLCLCIVITLHVSACFAIIKGTVFCA